MNDLYIYIFTHKYNSITVLATSQEQARKIIAAKKAHEYYFPCEVEELKLKKRLKADEPKIINYHIE